jgi:hypothetical protein
MSHTLNLKTTLTDKEAIISGLVRRGFNRNDIEAHDHAVRMDMYAGQTAQANIVVRKDAIQRCRSKVGMGTQYSSAFADLGFAQQADGTYKAVVDGSNFDENWINGLTQCYNAEKAARELNAKKIKYTEVKLPDGTIQFRAQFQQKASKKPLRQRNVSFG